MNPPLGSPNDPPRDSKGSVVTPRSMALIPLLPATPRPVEFAAPNLDVDERLVRRMKSGDELALGEFYDRWIPVVSAVVTRILKSPRDADEVIEATFRHIWQQAERFEPARGSIETWLLTTARTRTLERLGIARRRRAEPIDVGTLEPSAIGLARIDPSFALEHAERRGRVLEALADLPREQRETLELAYFGGLTQSEIATRTGLPLIAIKTRLRLALHKLRDRLVVRSEAPR